MESTIQDLRFALRMLRRSPGFTFVAVISLALGIGANTAIFSVMDALMLRMLPVQRPEQLVLFGDGNMSGVTDDFPHRQQELFSQPFYWEIRGRNDVFSDIAAIESMSGDVHGRFDKASTELEPVKLQLVAGNYFAMLGVPAAAGRVLTPDDDRMPGGAAVAVMRYGFWQRRFARDPSVIGRSISFNKTVFTIIGIAAPEFFGTEVGRAPDLWIPLAAQAQVQPWLGAPLGAQTQSLWLIGRMKPGIGIAKAQSYTNLRFQQWLHELAGSSPSAERVADMQKAHVKLTDAGRGISRLRRKFSRPLQILMVLVGLVLLIACANIANLLLARTGARRREIAVRKALGAQRRRLVSQLLSESLCLSLVGGCLGLMAATGGARLLLSMVSSGPDPVPLQLGLNIPTLLFTFGVSVLTGLIFGIMPALRITRVDVGPSLKEGRGLTRSLSHGRLASGLVAGQVALAFFLMIGAALFVATLTKLEQTSTGFEKDRVLLLQLDSDSTNAKGPALMALYRRLEARIQGLPGVRAASFSMLTFNQGEWNSPVWPRGLSHTEANAKSFSGNRVGAQYFDALGTPVVLGRAFGPQDTPQSQSVAVVNETFARDLYPNTAALGRHFALGDHDDFEIVGVVKDAKYQSLREQPVGVFFVYNGQEQSPDGFNDLVVRAQGRPNALIGEIRAAIHAENPNLAISDVMTLAEEVDRSLTEEKLLAKLAGFFGVLALLLSSLGLYGVIAYSVARRTSEIGIRMALGARPASILREVLSESLALVVLGLLAGLPVALACGRLVASQFYGVKTSDPLLIGGVAALLIITALAASFLPARRAALLDPLGALREE
ncbi:MAG TPA: ABC transporter permease [Bryobacteraceae bacterium]|jgi:predicted permease|nr:ABC transporter permease [Bryobacteraceae bacterium]